MITITDEDCEYVKLIKRPWCDTAIQNIDPFAEINKDRFSLSAHFVDITCGKYNQDVMAVLSGKKGAGKSYSTITIAYNCAKRTAIKLDNDVSKWKDYFDVERNMAVMDSDKMVDILTSKEKHQVIISDDSGVVNGARKFMSEENQLINNVMVVNRTLNNIYLSSAPESKHIDRQARDLPEHQIDFIRNRAGMATGFATCKYFEKITNPKTSESYYQYPYWRNMKILRCVIEKPPKELSDEYDRLREIGRDKKQAELRAKKEERMAKKEESSTPTKKEMTANQKKSERAKEKAEMAQTMVDELRYQGYTLKDALKTLKINYNTWKSWKFYGWVH